MSRVTTSTSSGFEHEFLTRSSSGVFLALMMRRAPHLLN